MAQVFLDNLFNMQSVKVARSPCIVFYAYICKEIIERVSAWYFCSQQRLWFYPSRAMIFHASFYIFLQLSSFRGRYCCYNISVCFLVFFFETQQNYWIRVFFF